MPDVRDILAAARQHLQAGRLSAAEQAFAQALPLCPGDPELWHDMGLVFARQGKYPQAIAAFQQTLRLHPAHVPAIQNLALAWSKDNRPDQAIATYQAALKLLPHWADGFDQLGVLLAKQKRPADAKTCFEEALRLRPDWQQAKLHLGKACNDLCCFDQAIACFHDVLRQNPNHVLALYELSFSLRGLNRISEAISTLDRVLEMDPAHPEARGGRALLYLISGDFERGWREYEHRWDAPTFPEKKPQLPPTPLDRPGFLKKKRDYPQPHWTGQDLAGRSIYLWGEQGIGDTIQFSRYAPLLAARGARVILECPENIVPLMKSLPGASQIVGKGRPIPSFDFHQSLMSLPLVLGTTLQSIPADIPYLSASQRLIESWQIKFQPWQGQFKVGLVWAGNPDHPNDRLRSCPLRHFAPLGELPNTVFFSLQKGPAAAQGAAPPPGLKLINLTAGLADFADTAAMIANLDLVIAVDTAVVHLAGALGRPVWTLLAFSPDWRWLLDRPDTPWYPTMRLYRQPAPGDWPSVLQQITADAAMENRK